MKKLKVEYTEKERGPGNCWGLAVVRRSLLALSNF